MSRSMTYKDLDSIMSALKHLHEAGVGPAGVRYSPSMIVWNEGCMAHHSIIIRFPLLLVPLTLSGSLSIAISSPSTLGGRLMAPAASLTLALPSL